MTLVKICGIRQPEHAVVAALAGADFIGLIFAESRRRVTVEQAREIVAALDNRIYYRQTPVTVGAAFPSVGRRIDARKWLRQSAEGIEAVLNVKRPLVVGVFVNSSAAEVNDVIDACGLDIVQLSGDEPWELCRELKRPAIKVLHVHGDESPKDIVRSAQPATASALMLDTAVNGGYGGSGRAFDWRLARKIAKDLPIMLAGGLTPENVGEAVRQVRPWAVDVSSGVETDGIKDVAKIQAFLQAAHAAG